MNSDMSPEARRARGRLGVAMRDGRTDDAAEYADVLRRDRVVRMARRLAAEAKQCAEPQDAMGEALAALDIEVRKV